MGMTEAQAKVLAVLDPGGLLTVEQIARDAGIGSYRARHAVAGLRSRGLIVHGLRTCQSRYQITGRGRAALLTRGKVFLPAGAAR